MDAQNPHFNDYVYTSVHQKGISKLEGGLILYPCREITDGNQAINILLL